ncbi:MAG: hypothetical protein J6R59_00315 [Paludibacteraceae bacterium]|nr:hypothetical protein [Paludibacteraceae bacterium]
MSDIYDIIQSPLNKTLEDKFIFVMNLPNCLKNLKSKYVKQLSETGIGTNSIAWSLTNVDIPTNSIKAESMPYAGGHHYVSSHTKTPYEPLKIEFKIDNNYANYFTIYEWMNLIYNEKEARYDAENLAGGKSGSNIYATQLAVIGTDEYNKPIIQWSFTHAFPTELQSIKLNYQNTGEITCSCSFVFS